MPSPYARDVARLKAEIVARVAGGASLRRLGAVAGAPCGQTVRAWARDDALFGAELAAAQRGAEAARLRFDEARAAEFLRRARAGETINGLLREPGMPTRRTYRWWLATQAPFAQAVFALRQRRDAEIGMHGRARRRGWDQGLADRIIVAVNRGATLEAALAADPALPSLPVVRRWRREEPEFDRVLRRIFAVWRSRRQAARGCTPAMVARVVRGLREGGSFNSLGREPGMPSRATLRRWLRARPDFAAAVARACDARDERYADRVLMIAQAATAQTAGAATEAVSQLKRQLARLRHRPGTVHRKRAPCAPRADRGA